MMKQLDWYFQKIEKSETVSLNSFLKAWVAAGLTHHHANRVFSIGQNLITIKDPEAFDELKGIYCVNAGRETRITAAVGGFSHTVRVDGSMVVLRSLSCPHPRVVLINPDGTFTGPDYHKNALVVENLQNFLLLENTIAFCQSIAPDFPSNIEVVWSEGNAINNALHSDFMTSFDQTWWLMDADLGGLKIMANALQYLPPHSFKILVPHDIESRLKHHGKLITDEKRDEIALIGNRCPALRPMAEPIFTQRRTLEQETYLLSSWGNSDEL